MKRVKLNIELETMLLCALRYSLTRHTYICDTTAKYIAQHLSDYSAPMLDRLNIELDNYLKEVDKQKELFNGIDTNIWKELSYKVKQEIAKRVNTESVLNKGELHNYNTIIIHNLLDKNNPQDKTTVYRKDNTDRKYKEIE